MQTKDRIIFILKFGYQQRSGRRRVGSLSDSQPRGSELNIGLTIVLGS